MSRDLSVRVSREHTQKWTDILKNEEVGLVSYFNGFVFSVFQCVFNHWTLMAKFTQILNKHVFRVPCHAICLCRYCSAGLICMIENKSEGNWICGPVNAGKLYNSVSDIWIIQRVLCEQEGVHQTSGQTVFKLRGADED